MAYVPLSPTARTWWQQNFGPESHVPVTRFANAFTQTFSPILPDYDPELMTLLCKYIVDDRQDGIVDQLKFSDFLQRFGPFEDCATKSIDSLFDKNTYELYPWFHGYVDQETVKNLLKVHPPGSFLLHYRDPGKQQDKIGYDYSSSNPRRVGYYKRTHILNGLDGFRSSCLEPNRRYRSFIDLLKDNPNRSLHPIVSPLSELVKRDDIVRAKTGISEYDAAVSAQMPSLDRPRSHSRADRVAPGPMARQPARSAYDRHFDMDAEMRRLNQQTYGNIASLHNVNEGKAPANVPARTPYASTSDFERPGTMAMLGKRDTGASMYGNVASLERPSIARQTSPYGSIRDFEARSPLNNYGDVSSLQQAARPQVRGDYASPSDLRPKNRRPSLHHQRSAPVGLGQQSKPPLRRPATFFQQPHYAQPSELNQQANRPNFSRGQTR